VSFAEQDCVQIREHEKLPCVIVGKPHICRSLSHTSVCSSLPVPTFKQERKKLLSFVIVGGGPTGVEVAAELHDLITEDLSKLYPDEVGCVWVFYWVGG